MESTSAVRVDGWKYVSRYPNGPYELYDMKQDAHERFNVYGQPGMEPKRTELAQKLDGFFTTYADPQYDIWKGGRSKAKRHTP